MLAIELEVRPSHRKRFLSSALEQVAAMGIYALLSDPQTSGGLLVAFSRSSAPEVLDVFSKHGFDAAVIGEAATGNVALVVA